MSQIIVFIWLAEQLNDNVKSGSEAEEKQTLIALKLLAHHIQYDAVIVCCFYYKLREHSDF